jgi:hypothetical protein
MAIPSAGDLELLRPRADDDRNASTHRMNMARGFEASFALLERRMAEAPELARKIDRLEAALARLGAAFERRVAALIAESGGDASLTEALRESARLAGAAFTDARDDARDVLGEALGDVDRQLKKLGVTPSRPPANPGRATAGLLAERERLAGQIDEVNAAAAAKESERAGQLVGTVCGGCASTFGIILMHARSNGAAFPDGFETAWEAIALASILEAGAADLVESLEAA